jgi:tetratricopeptide (TPR) repeat protein
MKLFFRVTFKIFVILIIVIGCATTQEVKKDADFYNNQGVAYDDKGQYDKAIANYNKAIELNPRYAEAYKNCGNAYLIKGWWGKAIDNYTQAIEINPRLGEAYGGRGVAYIGYRQFDKACSDVKRACELGACKGYEMFKKWRYCK